MYVASCKYYETRDTRAFIYGKNEEDCYFVSAAAKQDLKTLDYSFNQRESWVKWMKAFMRKNDDGDGDDDYKIVSFSTLLNLVGTMKRVMWFFKGFFLAF